MLQNEAPLSNLLQCKSAWSCVVYTCMPGNLIHWVIHHVSWSNLADDLADSVMLGYINDWLDVMVTNHHNLTTSFMEHSRWRAEKVDRRSKFYFCLWWVQGHPGKRSRHILSLSVVFDPWTLVTSAAAVVPVWGGKAEDLETRMIWFSFIWFYVIHSVWWASLRLICSETLVVLPVSGPQLPEQSHTHHRKQFKDTEISSQDQDKLLSRKVFTDVWNQIIITFTDRGQKYWSQREYLTATRAESTNSRTHEDSQAATFCCSVRFCRNQPSQFNSNQFDL